MAIFEDGSYSSSPGISLIAKVLAGRCKMHYTRAAVGKGKIPEGESPKTMSEPAEYVMDAKISAITNPVDGECQVTVQINSSDVEQGFFATGIVLYASDPDEGEVPYTYLVLENGPEWIRPASSAVGKLATFDLIAAVGDVDAVTAVIDLEAIATVGRVEQMLADHNADPNAHGGIGSTVISEITIPAAGWEKESEDGDYFLDVPVEGASASLVPSVALHRASLSVARNAGLRQTVSAIEGALRFWTAAVPTEDMAATAALFFQSASGIPGSVSIPVASSTTVGGVKVQTGSGLSLDCEGNLALDAASNAEVDSMIDEVYE